MDADELELVRSSMRGVLADGNGAPLPDRLRELGWDELVAEEPAGAIGALCEEEGRACASAGALDVVVAAVLDTTLDPAAAVVHPAVSAVDQPPGRGDGDALVVEGLALAPNAITLLVPTADGVALVDRDVLTTVRHEGFDETFGMVTVAGNVTAAVESLPAGWALVVDAARRALAHELIGVAEASLALAVEHVTQRHQFGHPIAAFQSVRHRLADVHVAITAAHCAASAAWAEPGFLAAAAAKALAGRAALMATRDAQQVCGALGFTWEHTLHRYLRRAWMLDALYGTSAELQRRIGASLVEKREVPRLRPLGSAGLAH
jgi:alkylation response protein AidB-like acyl-CoA dehydrogenase